MKHEFQCVFHHGMKTFERVERRSEAKTYISFKCLQTRMKHIERAFHMTSQTHGQIGE